MPHSSSTYRPCATALVAALVLLLGAGGPTLVHLCTMGMPPMVAEAPSEAPPCHENMAHGEMPMEDGAPAEETPAPCGPAVQACCLAVAAVPSDQAVVAEALPLEAPTYALRAAFTPRPVAHVWAPVPRDTGPPPAVRPHLALSVLLI